MEKKIMTAVDAIRARQAASMSPTTEKPQRLLPVPYVHSSTGANDQVLSTNVVLPTGGPMHTTLRPSSSQTMRILKVNNGTASSMAPTNLGFFQGGNSSDDDDDDGDDNNDDDNPRRRILGVHVASPNNSSQRGELIAILAAENVYLKKKNRRLRKDIDKLKRNLLDLQGSIKESIDEELKRQRKLNEENQQKNEETQKKYEEKLNDLRKKHQSDLEETTKRADRVVNENAKLQNEVDRLTTYNNELVRQVAKLQVEKETLENEVNELKQLVTESNQAIVELSNELQTTREMAKEAKDGYDKYREENEKQKRNDFNALLLGEIAFQFDRAVVRKVLHGNLDNLPTNQQERWDEYERTLTINQLKHKARNNELREDQMERWESFETFCKDQKWHEIDQLTNCLKVLKGPNRQDQAHLPQSDKDQQTVAMLSTVAQEACRNNSTILKNYNRLISSLAEYVECDKPLAKLL